MDPCPGTGYRLVGFETRWWEIDRRFMFVSDDNQHHSRRHPLLRGIGHGLGVLYILVTLLFGPIQSLARWLERQRLIQRYERWVGGLPPAAALAVALLSLGLLEVSKVAVLLSFRYFGVLAAVVVTVGAKASLGYFAHATWRAARPKVVATYAWAARVEAWVGAQLALLRGVRDRWLGYLRSRSWYPGRLNMDSSQFTALCDQQFQEGSEQAFAPNASVVHELKEAQVERQFFLRDPTMGSQPRAQQRPEALSRVDMDLMEAIPIFVTGVFAPAVTHRMMVKAPILQWVIDRVFIGMNPGSWGDKRLDEGTDGGLLDVLQHPDDHRAAALNHAENGRLFLLQGAPTPCPFQPAAPPPTAFFFTASGNPL
jgi:hypothetical protein